MARATPSEDWTPDQAHTHALRETFCQCVARGMPANRAYKEAFGDKVKDNTARTNSSRMLKSEAAVIARIKHLRTIAAPTADADSVITHADIARLMESVTMSLEAALAGAERAQASPVALAKLRREIVTQVGRADRLTDANSAATPASAGSDIDFAAMAERCAADTCQCQF